MCLISLPRTVFINETTKLTVYLTLSAGHDYPRIILVKIEQKINYW